MDLMTLAAKLTLDDSSYTKGINNATSMGEQLAGKMSAMTVAVGNIAADMITKAASSISQIFSNAMDSYADYQQLIGGVETLFKTSSSKVSQYAANAYKTAGLSANDYMETVTSFSASLLQGLGGDTEAAADLADVAITDMADNANKMGTDISSIQTAYQGFAKQNYTMLDNLKLGYGGTADEMVRLINDSDILETDIKNLDNITFDQMIEAIHAIQEEMGITGTTAAEAAETISGSKDSLVAAWNNLMAAVGGSTLMPFDEAVANFKESFSAYMENLSPTMLTTIANSGTLVEAVASAIADLPTKLLSQVADAGLGSGAQMVNSLSRVVEWIINSIVDLFSSLSIDSSKVSAFGTALGQFVGSAAQNILTNFPQLITDMISVGTTLAGSILTGIWQGLFGSESSNEIERINQELTNTIVDANVQSARAQSILTYMSKLEQQYGSAARETEEWKKAEGELEGVLAGSTDVFNTYGENVQGAISNLQTMTEELRKQAILNAYGTKIAELRSLQDQAQIEADTAAYTIETNQETVNSLNDAVAETAKAYAQELLNNNSLTEGSSEWYTAKNTLEVEGYAGTGLNVLISAIEDLYDNLDAEGSDTVWGKDTTDNIFSPEELSELSGRIGELAEETKTAQATLEESQQKVSDYGSEIDKLNALAARTQEELTNLTNSAQNASTSLSSSLVSAINTVVSKASTLGAGTETYMPRAVGIDYVPTNNFRTELHRGEAVLTKEENELRRSGYTDYSAMEDALTGAIESAMGRMRVDMNGERVADLTTSRIARNIDGSYRARVRSMGGY